jgi:hypothetical protein
MQKLIILQGAKPLRDELAAIRMQEDDYTLGSPIKGVVGEPGEIIDDMQYRGYFIPAFAAMEFGRKVEDIALAEYELVNVEMSEYGELSREDNLKLLEGTWKNEVHSSANPKEIDYSRIVLDPFLNNAEKSNGYPTPESWYGLKPTHSSFACSNSLGGVPSMRCSEECDTCKEAREESEDEELFKREEDNEQEILEGMNDDEQELDHVPGSPDLTPENAGSFDLCSIEAGGGYKCKVQCIACKTVEQEQLADEDEPTYKIHPDDRGQV